VFKRIKKVLIDNKQATNVEPVLKIVEPLPIKKPKRLLKIKPKRGKITIEINIKQKY
jgi:hypothetical protein